MAIIAEKLIMMNVKIVTKDATKYFIQSNVVFEEDKLSRFEQGIVKSLDKTQEMANFNAASNLSITFQGAVTDFTTMKEIMDAIETYMTETKAADPGTLLSQIETAYI